MPLTRLIVVFAAASIGCSSAPDKADDKGHFQIAVLPALVRDLSKLLVKAPDIRWEEPFERTETGGPDIAPHVTGKTFGKTGHMGQLEITFSGTYYRKTPELVFSTIRVVAKGAWKQTDFPPPVGSSARVSFPSSTV